MNNDIIEVRIYDQDHVKLFQFDARLNNKKDVNEMINLLHQKGIKLSIQKKDNGFF